MTISVVVCAWCLDLQTEAEEAAAIPVRLITPHRSQLQPYSEMLLALRHQVDLGRKSCLPAQAALGISRPLPSLTWSRRHGRSGRMTSRPSAFRLLPAGRDPIHYPVAQDPEIADSVNKTSRRIDI
jgi:hypothetical protein